MDDAAEQIAALGNIHRDAVSIPGAQGRHTDAGQYELKDERRRRMAHSRAAADTGNERVAKISAWNKQETFGGDSMVEGLANHFSGQGHRDQLQSQMGHQQHAPQGVPAPSKFNFGSGGRRTQGNGPQAPTAAPSLSSKTQGSRQAGLSLPTGLPTPAAVRPSVTSSSERPPAVRTQARQAQAAPVPVPMGTPIRVARTAATATSTPSVRITAAQGGTTARNSATVASLAQNIVRVTSPTRGTRSSATSVTSGSTTTATVIRVLREEASEIAANRITLTASPVDHYRNVVYIKMAEFYAANPGPKADEYYEKFPDRRPYLAKAIEQLAKKKATAVEKKSSSDEPEASGDGARVEATTSEDAQKAAEGSEDSDAKKTVQKKVVPDKAPAPAIVKKEVVKKAAAIETKKSDTTNKKEVAEKAPDAAIPPTKSERQPHKPGRQEPASSDDSSTHSIATVDSASSGFSTATTPPQSPAKMTMYGKLVVTYLDAESGHLFTHNMDVNAPVHANIQLTSRCAQYDPRNLEKAMKDLAKSLCLNDPNTVLGRGGDGLWQEVAEDDDEL